MTRTPWRESRAGILLVATFTYAAPALSYGALPLAIAARGGNSAAVGVAMGADAFTVVIARLIVGARMDRWGYRACLVGAAALLSAGQAGSSTAEPALLIAARLVSGLGIGALLAAGTGWLVELPTARGRLANTLGSIGTVNYTVLALGAPTGAWLATATTPVTALCVSAVPPLLAIPLLLVLRPPAAPVPTPSAHQAKRPARVTHLLGLGLALAAVGNPAVVAFGLRHGQDQHVASAGAAVLVYGLSLVIARVVLAPLTPQMTAPTPTLTVFGLEAAGLALLAITTNPVLYLTAAAMNGTAMAFTYPLVGAQLAERLGPTRGRALATLGAYVNLGIGLGAVLLGMLATRTTLTEALLVVSATTFIAGLLTWQTLHQKRP